MRLHLSTAFVAMLVAAALVGLNVTGQSSVDAQSKNLIKGDYRTMGWPWPYENTSVVQTVVWTAPAGLVTQSKVVTRADGSALFADALVSLAILLNAGGLYERIARGLKLIA